MSFGHKPRPSASIGTPQVRAWDYPTLDELLSQGTLPADTAVQPAHLPDQSHLLALQGHINPPTMSEATARYFYNNMSPSGPAGDEYYGAGPGTRLASGVSELARNTAHGGRKIDVSNQAAEDAWAMFLGLPQQFGSFEISPYAPTRSNEHGKTYLRLPDMWRNLAISELNPGAGAETSLMTQQEIQEREQQGLNESRSDEPGVRIDRTGVQRILSFIGNRRKRTIAGDNLSTYPVYEGDHPLAATQGDKQPRDYRRSGFALGNFTLYKGQDSDGPYIAYYDRYDFKAPGSGSIGTPYEIYDRLYYDPKTLEPRFNVQHSNRNRGLGMHRKQMQP